MGGRNQAINFAAALICALLLGAGAAHAQQAIAVGDEVSGILRNGDERRDGGEYMDSYVVNGRAGQRLEIALASPNLDPYLLVAGPGGFTAYNDDDRDAGTLNSRLEITLPADGAYVIGASVFAAGATGDYTLRVAQLDAAPVAATRERAGRRLTLGRAINGELRRGDSVLSTGEFADLYTFEGTAGQEVDVTLQSSEFDSYLIIGGPDGFQSDNDDDAAGGTLNSRITLTLPATGTYRVQATTYAAEETGAYTLAVNEGAGAPQPSAQLLGGRGAPLTSGQFVSGTLAAGDAQLQSGEFVDSYRFLGQRGQRVTVEMASSQIDTYIMLRAPSGEQEDNDDGPDGTNSRLETVLAEDGEYGVHATSYQAGESGDYRIGVTVSGDSERTVAEAPAASTSGNRLTLGRATQGRLEEGDGALSSGEFRDVYTFNGRAGQSVTFDMQSADLDSYLIVVSPSGEQQDNDDADPENGVRDSRLSWSLPEDGAYQIMATSYSAGETGAYTVRVTSGATAPTPSTPVAGAGGRVFALMVGISDYSGLANSLPYTADDARNLAQTMTQQGVLAQGSEVLTDNQATRAAVRAAFQRVSARAGPNDLFLFFFSGHGSQSEETSLSPEADLRDETIVMRDGEISDDEIAEWFAGVNARVSIIALDSCFSGGFARDVVNRPGIMGLFSSEEDLTSSVADKFQAGGYLSHFLRTGFGGEADGDGDLAITAGELSTYLWRKFASEVENEAAFTSERQRNYQRLVVDRGGVKIDDLILALN